MQLSDPSLDYTNNCSFVFDNNIHLDLHLQEEHQTIESVDIINYRNTFSYYLSKPLKFEFWGKNYNLSNFFTQFFWSVKKQWHITDHGLKHAVRQVFFMPNLFCKCMIQGFEKSQSISQPQIGLFRMSVVKHTTSERKGM